MDATTKTERSPLDEHIRDYLAEARVTIPTTISARELGDAVASGWYAAHAELAEELRDLIDEARAEVAKRKPFPILARLDALVTELENSLGQ